MEDVKMDEEGQCDSNLQVWVVRHSDVYLFLFFFFFDEIGFN